jgi:molybdopterin synthase catalytic subunit
VIDVVEADISVDAVLAAVEGPGEGAAVLFVGRVRNATAGSTVTHLEYECYREMALAEMSALADEALASHSAAAVAIVHRVGHLEIGDAAVAIAVSSAHRAEAYEASRWLIDTLKERVPIWKKEWHEDGGVWVSEHP